VIKELNRPMSLSLSLSLQRKSLQRKLVDKIAGQLVVGSLTV